MAKKTLDEKKKDIEEALQRDYDESKALTSRCVAEQRAPSDEESAKLFPLHRRVLRRKRIQSFRQQRKQRDRVRARA